LKYIDDRQRCTAQNQHTLKLAHPESNGTAIRLVPNGVARAGGGASCGSGAFNSASVALGCGTGSHAAQLARNDKRAKFTPELAEQTALDLTKMSCNIYFELLFAIHQTLVFSGKIRFSNVSLLH